MALFAALLCSVHIDFFASWPRGPDPLELLPVGLFFNIVLEHVGES
jgi:hypothetical protein